jgi:hypothetical protein
MGVGEGLGWGPRLSSPSSEPIQSFCACRLHGCTILLPRDAAVYLPKTIAVYLAGRAILRHQVHK